MTSKVNTINKKNFNALQQAMINYYGGEDVWNTIYGTSTATTPAQWATYVKALNNVSTLTSKSGITLSNSLIQTVSNVAISEFSNIGANANSNLTPALQGVGAATTIKIPLNTTLTAEGAIEAVTSGVRAFSGGVATALGTVVEGTVLPALAAVGTGAALGITVGNALYKANPNFWAKLSDMASDTWNNIVGYSESLKADVFPTLMSVKTLDSGANQSKIYISEDALAYTALYMQKNNMFTKTAKTTVPNDFPTISNELLPISRGSDTLTVKLINKKTGTITTYNIYDYSNVDNDGVVTYKTVSTTGSLTSISFTYIGYKKDKSGYTFNNKSVGIVGSVGSYGFKYNANENDVFYTGSVPTTVSSATYKTLTEGVKLWLAWLDAYATNYTYIEGVTPQIGAILPNLTDIEDTFDCLTALKGLYPNLWNERIENDVVQEDGTVKTIIYVGVPWLTGEQEQVVTSEGALAGVGVIEDELEGIADTNARIATILQTYIKTIEHEGGVVDTATPEPTPNPPIEGTGTTPSIIVPIGSAHALWSIYNPTITEINSLGSYLWSTNFIDQLLKMFNNPMEAVISLHKIFGMPPTDGTAEIKIGYLGTGVTDVNVVSKQYFTVDCGSVDLPEYFGNILDYNSFTDISLYLPFIGIVSIDNADVMRSTISIKYQIDVFTGACLAQVNVQRDAKGGILYQYTGNCAVQYPLSSGSYMSIVTGTLTGAAFGALGGKGIGRAVGGVVGGLAGLANNSMEYQRSGNFSGNAGAMGIKKPYLIISRPQTQIADNAQTLIGYPTNTYTSLSNCSGFTKVLECHVDSIGNASEEEKQQIETALKSGIIVK